MLILGALAFSIIILIIIITILFQCGSKDKDKSSLDNGKVVVGEHYKPTGDSLESGKDQEQHTDCKIDVETSEKSASLKPDKLVRETKVGKQCADSPDGSSKDSKVIGTKTEDENKVPLAGEQATPDDSKPHEVEVEDEGSFENSGDGIYTRVKSVEKKEECAYSIVNIANRDAEYEIVGGKLLRKPGEKKEKTNMSEYEVFDSGAKPKLDPILFAVEDSGASGIYEDVPDSKASLPQTGGNQTPVTDEQETKSSEVPEEHKKKWGLTRFSLMKRGKNKQHQDTPKGDKQSHTSGPTTPEKLDPTTNGSGENLMISHGKSENMFHRPKTDHVGLPPLPPLENRKLKEEHRRTYHESQNEGRESLEKMRTLSGTELGILQIDTDYDDDGMYEVPDRDSSMVTHKAAPLSPGGKLPPPRQGVSPKIQHRSVPKPPMQLVVTGDDMDGEANDTYDTISCSLALDGEDSSKKQDNSKGEARDKLEEDSPATEPEYAVVDKQQKQEYKTKPTSSVSSGEKIQSPTDEKKIEILIRRTTISSKPRGQVGAEETRKEVEVVERPPSHAAGSTDSNQFEHEFEHDSIPTPAALDDLYAKVNLEEKHREESKRALYATVDKPKTGHIKVYRSVSLEDDNEFEGGHYTRIKGNDDSATSNQSQPKNTAPATSDYETVGEQDLSAIFASLSPQKRAEIASGPATDKPNGTQATRDDANYEIIPQRDTNHARSKTSTKNAPENDYEEIVTEKRTIRRSHHISDDYMDIGDMGGQDFKF